MFACECLQLTKVTDRVVSQSNNLSQTERRKDRSLPLACFIHAAGILRFVYSEIASGP